jgi:glycosyltransferase involved in cell wall biosynthesis
MNVLQVCPLWYAVTPDAAGGIESLVASLSRHLARAGCRLTHLAPAGSDVAGDLVPVVERPLFDLMTEGLAGVYEPYEQHELRLAIERLPHMDLVHSHIGPGGFVLSAVAGNVPVVHTLHNPISDDLIRYFRQHPDDLLTTVSEFQRERLTAAGVTNRCEVIHNAVDAADYRFNDVPGDRALFMGRLDRHKGPDIALAAATAAGVPLDLAGPMTTPSFFDKTIRP